MASTTAWAGVCGLILVSPFESLEPIVRLPGQSLSSVEAALLVVFAAWAAALVWTRSLPRMSAGGGRGGLVAPWVVLVAALLVSAATAPAHRANALHMVGRLGLSLGVYVLTINAIASPARLRGLLIVSAVAGAIVATVVILDYFAVPPTNSVLKPFRPAVFLFGAQIRASGPFLYPTIASMYMEILFAFVCGVLLLAVDANRRVGVALLVVLLLVIGEAIVLTFTRSGFITALTSLIIIGGLRHRAEGIDQGVVALVVVACGIAALFLTSHSLEVLRLRLTAEGVSGYAATFSRTGDITLTTGGMAEIPIAVTNAGGTTWDPDAPQPFRLSYHWLLPDEDKVVNWEGVRTTFPSRVIPGQTVVLKAIVRAPVEPGAYRLLWDVEEVRRRWFSREPDALLFESRATVIGPATGTLPAQLASIPRRAERPGRMELWRAGARILASHPFRGIGPDNFRLTYGQYMGLATADPRLHSNNMYIELLVGGGVLAGSALCWFLWRASKLGWQLARHIANTDVVATASSAVLAASLAIGLHGLVDSFLSFTATYVLFAVTLGVASACQTLPEAHAHRL